MGWKARTDPSEEIPITPSKALPPTTKSSATFFLEVLPDFRSTAWTYPEKESYPTFPKNRSVKEINSENKPFAVTTNNSETSGEAAMEIGISSEMSSKEGDCLWGPVTSMIKI